MSSACLREWERCDRSYCQRNRECAEYAASAPAEAPSNPEFWTWLRQAYRNEDAFTSFNMEAAFMAGRSSVRVDPKPVRDCDSIEVRLYCMGWNDALAANRKPA